MKNKYQKIKKRKYKKQTFNYKSYDHNYLKNKLNTPNYSIKIMKAALEDKSRCWHRLVI